MKQAWAWIGDRLKEPSTWAGLGSLMIAGGAFAPGPWQAALIAIGGALGGTAAVRKG